MIDAPKAAEKGKEKPRELTQAEKKELAKKKKAEVGVSMPLPVPPRSCYHNIVIDVSAPVLVVRCSCSCASLYS
jgi:hypothetical protein